MKTISSVVLAVALMLGLTACQPTPVNPNDPVVKQDKIAKVSLAIRTGTSAVVAIGLVAIPNPEEARATAELAKKIVQENVIPVLQGDPAGLVANLQALLALKAFNDPRVAKIKMIIEAALPALEGNPEVAAFMSKQLDKVPDDVRAYVTAFFSGVNDGLNAYLGGQVKALVSSQPLPAAARTVDYKALRERLSAK